MAKKKSYEDMMNELNSIVEKMQNKDLSLDESLKNYEKGMKLYYKLYKMLNEMEGKIKILNENIEENFVKKEE